jgi:hypothetical protein
MDGPELLGCEKRDQPTELGVAQLAHAIEEPDARWGGGEDDLTPVERIVAATHEAVIDEAVE